jgi:2-methylaconitate cis-trans-isomerase PrpF
VQETGEFELDGVAFPAAEVPLEFIAPADEGEGGAMFPTGSGRTPRPSSFGGIPCFAKLPQLSLL